MVRPFYPETVHRLKVISQCTDIVLFCRFLILDPHYTGGEDLKVILDKVSLCVALHVR